MHPSLQAKVKQAIKILHLLLLVILAYLRSTVSKRFVWLDPNRFYTPNLQNKSGSEKKFRIPKVSVGVSRRKCGNIVKVWGYTNINNSSGMRPRLSVPPSLECGLPKKRKTFLRQRKHPLKIQNEEFRECWVLDTCYVMSCKYNKYSLLD